MKLFLSIFLLFISASSYCDPKWHSSTIEHLYPLANGGFVITFDTDSAVCSAAGEDKYHYVSIGENAMTIEGANKIYSLAMTAAVTDKEVSVLFDDSTNRCFINRMFVKF